MHFCTVFQMPCPTPSLCAHRCTPWYQAYGFFFGDGTYTDVRMRVDTTSFDDYADSFIDQCSDTPRSGDQTERDCTHQTDRFFDPYVDLIRLSNDRILHEYPSAYDTSGAEPTPWKVFFTSGERLSNLKNNKDGRFRLEAEVAIGSTNVLLTNGGYNRSPRASVIPVIPVPYISRSSGMSRFYISAFDPDVDDSVQFRLGDIREYGAVLANKFPGSRPLPERAFTPGYYTRFVESERASVYPDDDCSSCADCLQQASSVCRLGTVMRLHVPTSR